MMKAQKAASRRQDLQTQQIGRKRRPEADRESRTDAIAQLKAQLAARSDGAERIAHVEELKAQVEAGTYQIDSEKIAQSMQLSSYLQDMLGVGQHDLFGETEDERE